MSEPVSEWAHKLARQFVETEEPPAWLAHACDSALNYLSCLLREEQPTNKEIQDRLEELFRASETIELALGSIEIRAALDQHTGAETAEVGPEVSERLKQARDAAAWLRNFTGRAAFGVEVGKGIGRRRLAGAGLDDREYVAALIISLWRELHGVRPRPGTREILKACQIAFEAASLLAQRSQPSRLNPGSDLRNWSRVLKRTQLQLDQVVGREDVMHANWKALAATMILDGKCMHLKCSI